MERSTSRASPTYEFSLDDKTLCAAQERGAHQAEPPEPADPGWPTQAARFPAPRLNLTDDRLPTASNPLPIPLPASRVLLSSEDSRRQLHIVGDSCLIPMSRPQGPSADEGMRYETGLRVVVMTELLGPAPLICSVFLYNDAAL